MTTRTTIGRTEHAHLLKDGGLEGQPRIDDQRISVLQHFDMCISGWPFAEIHDAISDGYDHPDEMDD
jgi:hypothetical protein